MLSVTVKTLDSQTKKFEIPDSVSALSLNLYQNKLLKLQYSLFLHCVYFTRRFILGEKMQFEQYSFVCVWFVDYN